MMQRIADGTWIVEARQESVAEWKRIARAAAESRPPVSLHLVFAGGANQITGYRLYYMLQYAKRAGVADLELETDGAFWIDEATDWLLDSGVDRITVSAPNGWPGEALAARIQDLSDRVTASGRGPRVEVRVVK